AEVKDAADRRADIRGDLDQVEPGFVRAAERLDRIDDAHFLIVLVEQKDLLGADAIVDGRSTVDRILRAEKALTCDDRDPLTLGNNCRHTDPRRTFGGGAAEQAKLGSGAMRRVAYG